MVARTRRALLPLSIALALTLAAPPQRARAQTDDRTPPRLLEHAEAPYPPSKIAEHIEADVLLVVDVEEDGTVSSARVVESGGAAFDQAALDAVKTWRFAPAQKLGKPAKARIKIPFHFAPPHPDPAGPPKEPAKDGPKGAPKDPSNVGDKPNKPPAHAEHAAPTVVNVLGRAPILSRGASDFLIHVGELGRVPRKNASDMLTLAPGILLTNEGGEGHAEQVFLRGFDAREGQDLEFSVGGVPINEAGNLHANGYADTHFIIPELIASLRIVEGPFDPRQGNFAVAGSAEYELGLVQRGLTAKYTGGAFNTHRLLVMYGPRDESLHTFGAAEIYRTDGFGQNRDSKRATAMGQYEGKIGSNTTFRITGTGYLNRYHSAGVMRDDDYRAKRKGFYDTYDPSQGGSSTRFSIAADVEGRAGDFTLHQLVYGVYRGMRLVENFTGFLLDTQEPRETPHPQRGDALDLDLTSQTIGARGFARLRGKLFGETQELELGYFARGDHVDATRVRVERATGHPYKIDASFDSKIGDIGLYADANLKPVSWLAVRGGLRGDLLAYDVTNRCAVKDVANPSKLNPPGDASCLSQQDFGQYREPFQRASTASIVLLPRASVLVGPFAGFTISGSVGRGVRSIDPSYITQDVDTPFASVLAYEGGVAFARQVGPVALTAKSILFQTRVSRDLIFSETEGRNVLGGATTRTGWVLSSRATGDHFDLSGSMTLVKSIFEDTGLLLPYVPDAVVRVDGAGFGALPWRIRGDAVKLSGGLGFTFVGRRPLPYGQRSDVIATLDASMSVAWSHYEIGVTATNLANQRYRLGEYNFASDFQQGGASTLVPVRHFTAGAPIGVFASLAVNFGGEP